MKLTAFEEFLVLRRCKGVKLKYINLNLEITRARKEQKYWHRKINKLHKELK